MRQKKKLVSNRLCSPMIMGDEHNKTEKKAVANIVVNTKQSSISTWLRRRGRSVS